MRPSRPHLIRTLPAVLVASLLLAATLLAGPASAHTEIVSTTPAADAVVPDPPSELVIEFGGDLAPDGTVEVRVLDPAGDDLVAGDLLVEGRTVTVPLNLAIAEGVHEVDVAFTAVDGDDQVESFAYTFAPPAAIATPTEDLTGPPVDPSPTTTPTPTPTPTPTTEPEVTAMSEPATEEAGSEEAEGSEEALVSADDGGVGIGVVVLALVVAAAIGAVLVLRMRRPAFGDSGVPDRGVADGGVADPDQDR